jgi:hypothetical protein
MEDKKEIKLRSLAKKLEGLMPHDSTPQDIYSSLVGLIKSQPEYFKLFDVKFLISLVFYIYSFKKTGDFILGKKMVDNLFFASFMVPSDKNHMEDCKECEGYGDISCHNCYGSGSVDCTNCDSNGKEECYECDGEGWQSCDSCDGTGEDEEGNECTNCGGTGEVSCELCSGRKEVDCTVCDGNNDLTCPECNGNERETCQDCDGLGEIETDELEYDVYEICSWSKDMYNRCELLCNTDRPTFTNEDYNNLKNDFILLHMFEDNAELIDELETDEFYCFDFSTLQETDLRLTSLDKAITPSSHDVPRYYIK